MGFNINVEKNVELEINHFVTPNETASGVNHQFIKILGKRLIEIFA